jgi:hypothetical protein
MHSPSTSEPQSAAITLVLIASLTLGGCEPPSTRWYDPIQVKIPLQVVDDDSEAPIAAAAVVMIDPSGRRLPAVRADNQGRISVTEPFEASGSQNPQGKAGHITFDGWFVEASAEGYLAFFRPLADIIGAGMAVGTSPPEGRPIRLSTASLDSVKAHSSVEEFTRSAGNRIRLFLYGDRFFYEILNDGDDHGGSRLISVACGAVVRRDGFLKLQIERSKRIDENEYDWHLDDLYRVPWGERLYLVSQSQWLRFCTASNQGEEPRSSWLGAYFLRAGDQMKSAEGLPHVPPPWDGFLLAKPVQARVVKMLPSGWAEIDAGSKAGLRSGMELLPTRYHLFSAQVVESVGEWDAVIKAEYPQGNYRRIQLGDTVVSREPGR